VLDAGLVPALLALAEPDERGDPESPLRWTAKSLRHLAGELARQGHPVPAPTVGGLPRENGFSLPGNAKTLEGDRHPDRDAQFRYINGQAKDHQAAGEPVISVDTKKREQLGRLPAGGREWRPKGEPARDYPQASRLLVTADAGGSTSYRYRVWKSELAALAAETGLAITVCHYPPGTSKWNKIEHRLFCRITLNWRGRPLTSHEVVVQTIAATRARAGLRAEAALDAGDYPAGAAISKERMAALPLEPHAPHGAWTYTLHPRRACGSAETAPAGESRGPAQRRQAMLGRLADPRLTGMTAAQLQQLTATLAPAQAARAQQRYSRQRGGRARRATGNPRARPLFDDAARLLLTLLYQRQVCSMNALADLLEVTATCIGDLVKQTREILEDHGHIPGLPRSGSPPPRPCSASWTATCARRGPR
jgi:Rhodopirellula transposase DDE domain